jgi:peptide/nickel transport system ATP-binding protein
MKAPEDAFLEVESLKKHFAIQKGLLKKQVGVIKAVDGVDLFVRRAETLGVVGESGCGKSTLGKAILRAFDLTQGRILMRIDDEMLDLTAIPPNELRPLRRHFQMVFQDPYSSLDPRMTIMDIVAEPLRIARLARGTDLEDRVRSLVDRVGLKVEHLKRYPHAFSGGQRQRVGIARALITNPSFVVCDEPVSALDVSIQAQILNLLQDLQQEFRLTYLFISHDLSVVQHIANRVLVMYTGKAVELAGTRDLFDAPKHPYTEALLSAVPMVKERTREKIVLQGEVANPAHPPLGCYFHPRCPHARPVCRTEEPEWREIEPGRFVACHFADVLQLAGVG